MCLVGTSLNTKRAVFHIEFVEALTDPRWQCCCGLRWLMNRTMGPSPTNKTSLVTGCGDLYIIAILQKLQWNGRWMTVASLDGRWVVLNRRTPG